MGILYLKYPEIVRYLLNANSWLFNQSDRFLFEFRRVDFSILHSNLQFRMELLNCSSGFLGEDHLIVA
jgi:hypothetical protein